MAPPPILLVQFVELLHHNFLNVQGIKKTFTLLRTVGKTGLRSSSLCTTTIIGKKVKNIKEKKCFGWNDFRINTVKTPTFWNHIFPQNNTTCRSIGLYCFIRIHTTDDDTSWVFDSQKWNLEKTSQGVKWGFQIEAFIVWCLVLHTDKTGSTKNFDGNLCILFCLDAYLWIYYWQKFEAKLLLKIFIFFPQT